MQIVDIFLVRYLTYCSSIFFSSVKINSKTSIFFSRFCVKSERTLSKLFYTCSLSFYVNYYTDTFTSSSDISSHNMYETMNQIKPFHLCCIVVYNWYQLVPTYPKLLLMNIHFLFYPSQSLCTSILQYYHTCYTIISDGSEMSIYRGRMLVKYIPEAHNV